MIALDAQRIGSVRQMEGWQELIRELEAQHIRLLSEHLFRSDMGKDGVRAAHELMDDLITELKRVSQEPE